MTDFLFGVFVCLFVCFSVSMSFASFSMFWLAITYADKRIANIIRVSIERNNLQVELIRFRKKIFT